MPKTTSYECLLCGQAGNNNFCLITPIFETQGRSIPWLASQLGKSRARVSDNVNNHSQPSLDVFYKIASILGVSVHDLIEEKG